MADRKRYADRPSPPLPANEHCGLVRTGNDGRRYRSTPDKNGRCRWVPMKTAPRNGKNPGGTPRAAQRPAAHAPAPPGGRRRSWLTLDNDAWAFLVAAQGRKGCYTVTISKAPDDYPSKKREFTETVRVYEGVLDVRVGKSPKNNMTEFSGGHGAKFDGNSILLLLRENKGGCVYAFVGDTVYEFSTQDPVVKFHSPVGNNGVPYPVALTARHVYFLLEAPRHHRKDRARPFVIERVARGEFPEGTDWTDPWDFYYAEREKVADTVPARLVHGRG